MPRLTQSELDALADSTFATQKDPRITAEDLRNYFKITTANNKSAYAYAFLIGSVSTNQFTQTFNDSIDSKIKFLNNPDWGGTVEIGGLIDSVPFALGEDPEFVGVPTDNWIRSNINADVVVDASLHVQATSSDNRQVVADLVKVGTDGITTTQFGYDIYANIRTNGRSDSITFPSSNITLLAGERLYLSIRMAPGEADTELEFLKCLLTVRLVKKLD